MIKSFYINIPSAESSEGKTLLTPEEKKLFDNGTAILSIASGGLSSHFPEYGGSSNYRFMINNNLRLTIYDIDAVDIRKSATGSTTPMPVGSIDIPEGMYDFRDNNLEFYFVLDEFKDIDIPTNYFDEWHNLIDLSADKPELKANTTATFSTGVINSSKLVTSETIDFSKILANCVMREEFEAANFGNSEATFEALLQTKF